MVKCNIFRVLLSCSLLLCYAYACPHTNDRVSYIDDIRTCNGSDVVVSFNISGVTQCTEDFHNDYYIFIYYHEFPSHITHEKLPDPIFHNETGLCQVFLTLYNVTYEEFMGATLQVQIHIPPKYSNCSNNFSLFFDTDPPSPVSTLDPHINCSGAFLSWLKPNSSLSCPILHYLLILNNQSDIITPQSFFKYSWSELSHNTLYTVSIVAVSGAGSSIESNSTEFTTTLAPKVSMIGHDVLLLVEDAVVLVKAKVANTDCPFSYPSHVQYSIQCNGGYVKNYTFNVTVNDTNGSIIQHGKPSLPLGLCHCKALISWYNRNNNSQEYINFNTSLSPISINVNDSTCEMFFINCSYSLSLSNSTLLGCSVDIFNSTSRIASKLIPFLDSWSTSLYPGDYNISVVGCYDDDCVRNVSVCQDAKRFINIKKCHISSVTTTITSAPATVIPTSSSSSTPSSGSDNTVAIVLSVVIASLFIIIIIGVFCILAVCFLRKKQKEGHFEVPQDPNQSGSIQPPVPDQSGFKEAVESAVPSELGTHVVSAAPMPSKNMGDSIALQTMGKGLYDDNNETADNTTTCRTFSETETTFVKTEANEEQDDVPMSYDTIAQEQEESTYSATGGDTNPPPVPDKKSKGAATTGQGTNDGNDDAAQDLSHDAVIDETQARTPTGIKMVTGIEDVATIDKANADETSDVNSSPTQTNSDNPKQSQPEENVQSKSLLIKGSVQQTDDSIDISNKTYAGYLKPRRSSIPEGSFLSAVASTDSKPPAKKNDDKESEMANVSPIASTEREEQ